MDYVRKTRLKIYARAEIVELTARPDLLAQLDSADYRHTPERMILLHIEAYDWNCPQHITPRYSIDEINDALALLKDYISKLEAKVAVLTKEQNQEGK